MFIDSVKNTDVVILHYFKEYVCTGVAVGWVH